jgi:hypothetical protein
MRDSIEKKRKNAKMDGTLAIKPVPLPVTDGVII